MDETLTASFWAAIRPQITLLHFEPCWASREGGLGGLWGALGPPLGPLGASFGAPRGVWGRLWSGLGGRSGRKLDKHTLLGRMLALFYLFGGVFVDAFLLLTWGVAGAVCCTGCG